MSNHLTTAKEKFNMNKTMDYSLSLNDFICSAYVKLNPCSYGSQIQERLRRELNVDKVKASENVGDFKIKSRYFELKVSFLSNKTPTYNITHIRPWQHINYYLLCFVDCKNDFRPNFYLINKQDINKFKLAPMNGTPQSNSSNFNIELRTTISNDSGDIKVLKRLNLLKDTSLESLKRFISTLW
jgi:hypothetical protein